MSTNGSRIERLRLNSGWVRMWHPTMRTKVTTCVSQLGWGDPAEAVDDDDRPAISLEVVVPAE